VHIYIGAITGVASSQLGSISIGYFMNNIQVGYFSLAITASMPLTLIPSTVGTTFFREFAKTNKISKKIFLTTLLVSLSSLTLFLIFIKPLISLLYSDEFLPVVDLAYYISIGAMFHGLGDFFNRFLSAQGKGVYLKRVNIFLGVFNLLGYILFVYIWSLQGAVYTRLISGILYFLLMLVFYSLHLKHGR
jgi:O-antigen/teichoic acid export membrane protein